MVLSVSTDAAAGTDSLPWWLFLIIILGVLTVLSVAVIYAQRKSSSANLYTDSTALPYSHGGGMVMGQMAETSFHDANSQIVYTGMEGENVTSLTNPYFTPVNARLNTSAVRPDSYIDDLGDVLLGTIPLSNMTGLLRDNQIQSLEDQLQRAGELFQAINDASPNLVCASNVIVARQSVAVNFVALYGCDASELSDCYQIYSVKFTMPNNDSQICNVKFTTSAIAHPPSCMVTQVAPPGHGPKTPVTFPAFPDKHVYLFYKDPQPEEHGAMWGALWDANAECVVRMNKGSAAGAPVYYPDTPEVPSGSILLVFCSVTVAQLSGNVCCRRFRT